MFNRTGLFTIVAASAVVLAACEQKPAEAPPSDAAPTNVVATTNAATTATGGTVPGETCGGIAGQKCTTAGDFCKTPAGQCGVADAQGTCTKPPEICPKDYNPVCGCDNKTYGNACEADAAGVNVQTVGVCPKPKS